MIFKKFFTFFLTSTTLSPYNHKPLEFSNKLFIQNNNNNPISFFTGKFDGYGLDVNCKTGESTQLLSKNYPNLKLYGIDKDEENIMTAQKRFHNSDFIAMDFENYTGIKQDFFQLIQVSDYDSLMTSFVKGIQLLNKDGLLIIKCKTSYDMEQLESYIKKNYYLFEKKQFNSTFYYHIDRDKLYVVK